MTINNPNFKIEDEVFYSTPGSPPGIILDIRYYIKTGTFEYLVGWDYTSQSWYLNSELTYTKILDM